MSSAENSTQSAKVNMMDMLVFWQKILFVVHAKNNYNTFLPSCLIS